MMRYQKIIAGMVAIFILVFALFALVCPMQVNAMLSAGSHGCGATQQTPINDFAASVPCLQNHVDTYLSMIGPVPGQLLWALGILAAVVVVFAAFHRKNYSSTPLRVQQAVCRFIFAVQSPRVLVKAQRWLSLCVTNENTSLA